MLICENIHKSFEGIELFGGISFEVREREFVAVVGPSGSGKTTLLMIIVGLLKPDKGKIFFMGKELTSMKKQDVENIRRKYIGLVFQEPNLFNYMTSKENVECCAALTSVVKGKDIDRLFSDLSLDRAKNRKVKHLSGGEKQRVSLARALSKRPKLLIADEPTASLDHENTRKMLELLDKLRDDYTLTIVVATHDPVVMKKADKLIKLREV